MNHSLRIRARVGAGALSLGLLLGHAGMVHAADTVVAEPDPIATLQSVYAAAVKPGEQAESYRELLGRVLSRVQRSHVREVDLPALTATAARTLAAVAPGTGDPAEAFKKAMNDALRGLDPYSRYLDAQAQGNDRSESSGSFGGLGLEVEPGDPAGVRIAATVPDSPAARAGIRAGDLIVRVDEQDLAGVAISDAVTRMRGAPGTSVTLTVRRSGAAQDLTFPITRETIRRQALRWSIEEGDVLVLRLATFSAPVSAAIEQAVSQASSAAPLKAVVLDMRGNPGGLLREGIRTADLFLGKGEIVSLRGRTPGNQRSWQADEAQLLPGVPMVVLLDRRSASASELVAAALQDNGRAVVMGQRSYGKGSVQSTYSLGESHGALRLTSAMYIGPGGHSVQDVGVVPDVELVLASPVDNRPPPAVAVAVAVPKARIEAARCAASAPAAPTAPRADKPFDEATACAIAYLRAGEMGSFRAALDAAAH